MTPEERAQFTARMHRIRAEWLRLQAAKEDLNATAVEASESIRRFVEAFTEAERQEIAQHPDLAELNLQLEGYYGEERKG